MKQRSLISILFNLLYLIVGGLAGAFLAVHFASRDSNHEAMLPMRAPVYIGAGGTVHEIREGYSATGPANRIGTELYQTLSGGIEREYSIENLEAYAADKQALAKTINLASESHRPLTITLGARGTEATVQPDH